jgi:hypothetical protein
MKTKILIGFALLYAGLEQLQAQSSVFTYQGRLFDNNKAAVGAYEFQFRLADSATNGNYVGPALFQGPVSVTNGVFTVNLDFGPGIFDGTPRFLEAGVRTNGSVAGYTVLQPLQPITTAPYAMMANSAVAAGVASNLVAGAVLTNLTIVGSAILAGTITPTQIDPSTDAAYRALDTNAVLALIAQAMVSPQVIPGSPTSSRFVDAKLDFGAKGDGITDDTEAIQAGLDYLGSSAATNANFYLPPGTYKITSTLKVPPNSFPINQVLGFNTGWRISGSGMTSTRLYWPNLNNGIGLAMTNGIGHEGVSIKDLTLVGPLMNSWNSADKSIGLCIGAYTEVGSWSGGNNVIENCALMGWGYGATATNQWGLVFDNCVVASNNYEGLRFAGSHLVSVQNCRVRGGYATACGIGIGFHPPLNWGYGDNAQIMNTFIFQCTNGILNQELNLVALNTHLEACGSYFTLVSPTQIGAGPPATTIVGGYTLDWPTPWTNGFAAQMLLDPGSARLTLVQNCWFTGGANPRPLFNVTNSNPALFTLPTYLGRFYFNGLWNTTSNVVVYPLGTNPSSSTNLSPSPLVAPMLKDPSSQPPWRRTAASPMAQARTLQ